MLVSLELTYLLSGAALGATAGLSPGPLQTLVISETLRHGRKEGMKVSFAPLLTDLPIIVAAVFFLSSLNHLNTLMGIVSICGALFLARLAYFNLKPADGQETTAAVEPASLKKAVITNFLSPHPYMFWIFVGAPTVLAAARKGTLAAGAFVFGFYIVLVGIFVLLAVGAGKSRRWMHGKAYRWVVRGLGGVLLVFSFLFFLKGLQLLGVV